jgi:hypothetical protein
MTSQTIEIIINAKGETTVQTKGFTGSSCRDASRLIEQALGHKTAEKLTAEFHQPQIAQQVLKAAGSPSS